MKSWQQGCESSLTKLLWGNRSEIDPLYPFNTNEHKEELVAQFDNNARHIFGLSKLAKGAWQRLTSEGFNPTIEGICAFLARKQHDYGHGNILAFGQRGVIVRLCDKLSRLYNLDRFDLDPSNESLVDTLLDIIGYCTISDMLTEDTFTLPLDDLFGDPL
jgi:hypothetical protein